MGGDLFSTSVVRVIGSVVRVIGFVVRNLRFYRP